MTGVLEGIRVLDFGRFIAGPWCGDLASIQGRFAVRFQDMLFDHQSVRGRQGGRQQCTLNFLAFPGGIAVPERCHSAEGG